MSVLDAFMSTWSAARTTFGEGALPDGSHFDQSAALRQMQDTVASAAPGSTWTGEAADSYADANDKQARTLGNIADLDRRLGVEVDRSAAVVAAGRRDLDAVKQWVFDAAATVPKTEAGERMLLPIVSKGSSQIHDIVTRSNSDLAAIAQRIRGLGREYDQLTGDEKKTDGLNAVGGLKEAPPPPVDPLDEIRRKYQVSEDPDGALDWEPRWPYSLFTKPMHVTASEARILKGLSPLELRDMKQIKEAAENEAKERFPPQHGPKDTADNHTDAFRHAYWNALMTQRFGEGWTKDFTTAHERLPDNPATAEAMDLYNNEVGRKIASANPDATPGQLADLVQAAVNRGDTVVVAPGENSERLAWSDTVAQGGAGHTSPSTVPGVDVPPTGRPPGGIYDPGGPGGYTTSGGY